MKEYLKTIATCIGETNELLQSVANRIEQTVGETNELLQSVASVANRIEQTNGVTNELLQDVANRLEKTNELLDTNVRAPRGNGAQAAQALRKS